MKFKFTLICLLINLCFSFDEEYDNFIITPELMRVNVNEFTQTYLNEHQDQQTVSLSKVVQRAFLSVVGLRFNFSGGNSTYCVGITYNQEGNDQRSFHPLEENLGREYINNITDAAAKLELLSADIIKNSFILTSSKCLNALRFPRYLKSRNPEFESLDIFTLNSRNLVSKSTNYENLLPNPIHFLSEDLITSNEQTNTTLIRFTDKNKLNSNPSSTITTGQIFIPFVPLSIYDFNLKFFKNEFSDTFQNSSTSATLPMKGLAYYISDKIEGNELLRGFFTVSITSNNNSTPILTWSKLDPEKLRITKYFIKNDLVDDTTAYSPQSYIYRLPDENNLHQFDTINEFGNPLFFCTSYNILYKDESHNLIYPTCIPIGFFDHVGSIKFANGKTKSALIYYPYSLKIKENGYYSAYVTVLLSTIFNQDSSKNNDDITVDEGASNKTASRTSPLVTRVKRKKTHPSTTDKSENGTMHVNRKPESNPDSNVSNQGAGASSQAK